MNSFLFKPDLLLSGQSGPVTGERINISRARDAAFTVFYSGNSPASVTLQYQSPFFQNDFIDFYRFNNLISGYATPAYMTTPFGVIRAVASGNGAFWAAVTYQN